MLRFIRIRDFALIRALEIEFAPGLNLLTGETGSGKSILVDALGILIGERASQEMVRSGCEQAILEAIFSFDPESRLRLMLQEAGIDAEDGQLLIRREISSSGRNRIFVNDSLATLSLLKALGEQVADIHGQQEHHALLNLRSHLEFLDRFGENAAAVSGLRELHLRLREIEKRLGSIEMDEQERLKRVDMLQFQLEEIRRADPRPLEREELEDEKRVLANREAVFAAAGELHGFLYEREESILGKAQRAARLLDQLERFDSRWGPYRETLSECIFKLEDLARYAREYRDRIDFSGERLEQVERRLSELERLARKYGHSVSEIIEYGDKCERELLELVSHKERVQLLEEQLQAELKQYRARAERLSAKRQKDARLLEREIRKELQALSMDQAGFSVRFHARDVGGKGARIPGYFTESGIDSVEFMVSPNKGEELKPVARIASGGELSRIMLSLKALCGTGDAGRTLVFDEVDAGIGGRVAEAVGRRLRDLSGANQVLCVTHLPQIAAFAASHYRVSKAATAARTETFVQLLDECERVEELARMLGGETITETTRRHAREMLAHSLISARKGPDS